MFVCFLKGILNEKAQQTSRVCILSSLLRPGAAVSFNPYPFQLSAFCVFPFLTALWKQRYHKTNRISFTVRCGLLTSCADKWDTASGPGNVKMWRHRKNQLQSWKSLKWCAQGSFLTQSWKLWSLTCSYYDSSWEKPSFVSHVLHWWEVQNSWFNVPTFTLAELFSNGTCIKYNYLTFTGDDFERNTKEVMLTITLVICINIHFEHWEKMISIWYSHFSW